MKNMRSKSRMAVAAQLSSFFVKQIYQLEGFIGFAGIDSAKFRNPVEPGKRLYLACPSYKIQA
ncbi:MAG: hypothetical protein JXB29_05385 [Sedimentisphaerales bacterium]|nr:hypothetical protein [Sedimentisphaerales bacterium]